MSRRSLLNVGAQAGLIGTLSALGLLGASAPANAAVSDYKALVCLYLFGGNDGNNLIVPLDFKHFAQYSAIRAGSGLALSTASKTLLPARTATLSAAAPVEQEFAFHYGMPELDSLYQRGHVAAILNVGSLSGPMSKADYLAGTAIPPQLFSHPEQMLQNQTGTPSAAGTGWGGRLLDALGGAKPSDAVSVGAGNQFLTGQNGHTGKAARTAMADWPHDGTARALAAADSALTNGMDLVIDLQMPAAQAALSTLFPGYSLAAQLNTVAQMIRVRAEQGPGRQVYFVSLSGFDTHGAQAYQQFDMLRQVSQSLGAFQEALEEIGMQENVTTFTMSEFGRTLQPDGGGTDHGWGNHHMVVGAAVRGGVYGAFPDFTLGGKDDATGRGAWIPQFSNQQFGATLGKWFGAQPDSLAMRVFNNELSNFARKDLGFMG